MPASVKTFTSTLDQVRCRRPGPHAGRNPSPGSGTSTRTVSIRAILTDAPSRGRLPRAVDRLPILGVGTAVGNRGGGAGRGRVQFPPRAWRRRGVSTVSQSGDLERATELWREAYRHQMQGDLDRAIELYRQSI